MFKKTADHIKSNDATIKYFEKIASKNSMQNVTITEKSTIRDLELEFKNMYKANQVGSVRDYIRYLDQGEYPMKMFDVIDNQVQFDRILDYLHQEAIREQVKVDPLETLKQFVDSQPSQKGKYEIIKAIRGSGHKESIDNFVRYCLLKTESKRGAIWEWGVSNSGKTTKLKMYGEIFNVVNYTQTRSRFDLNYDKMLKAPQFIMIDEGAASTFFSNKSQWDDSKLFFEGQGYVCEAKHQHPEKRWQDVPIIVTSNTLPYVLCDDVTEKDLKVHRFAFQ